MKIEYPQLTPPANNFTSYRAGDVIAQIGAPRRPLLLIQGPDGPTDRHLLCLTNHVILPPAERSAMFFEYRASLLLEMP